MNMPRSADGMALIVLRGRIPSSRRSVQRCHEVFDTMIRSLLILRWIMLKSDRELQVAL